MRRTASEPPQLPGYEYERLLGGGGFSDVFLYRQRLPRRQVAVKVLLTDDLTAAARRAFVDEANLMAQLSAHPFIVTIYGADIAEGDRPYFVMEYCSGPSLSDRYKRQPFSAVDALRTGVRLASAVATAHAAGILHRDIKPANVLTNDYGWPALTDFGIASAVDELPMTTTTTGALRDDESTGATGTGSQSVGLSVPWSPPEMFEDDPAPDVRSDVFSLAATIWTLLAGRTPFEIPGRGNGALDLIGRIERGRITPMDRDDLPRSLVAVLQKGMSARREDRWQSAAEFARALQRVELELGYAATTIDVPALADEPALEHGDADADETRMRSVATIEAQPPRPAPGPIAAPPLASAPGGPATGAPAPAAPAAVPVEPTRLRGVAELDAQQTARAAPAEEGTVLRPRGAAEPVETDEAPVPAETGRRPHLGAIIAIVASVLVVAGVGVAIAVAGAGVIAQPRPTHTATGGSALGGGGVVQQPRFLSAAPSTDGTTVTFTFAAVKGADGYSWAPSDQPDAATGVRDPVAVRTGVTPGQRVCVQLLAIKAGKTSEAREACYPS